MTYFILYNTIIIREEITKFFLDNISQVYKLLNDIILDLNSWFISNF